MATGNPCLAAALAYASNATRPLFVFPAKPGEKKSRLSKQFSADGRNWGMTNNSETIRKYWQQFPDSNVCIVTGDINGLFVVETDTAAHGKDGAAELDRLIKENGNDWPNTLTAESPSGSKHYYFTWPNADVVIINSDSKLAPGVDVRGDGGMVVAPPSFAPKYNDYYRWISPADVGIASAPIWLLKLLCKKPPDKKIGEPQADIEKLKQAMEYIPNGTANTIWEVSDYRTGEVNTREGWEGWNTISMALYRATAGSDAGYAIFREWCAKNKAKFNERYTHYTWHVRYKRSPPRTLGAGTLFTIAEDNAPGWQKIWDHEHHEEIIEAKIEKANTEKTVGSGKTESKKTTKDDQKIVESVSVEETVDKPVLSNKAKYEIKLTTGNNNNVKETEAFLIASGCAIYVYGNRLVRPIHTSVKAMEDRLTNVAQLHDLEVDYLQWLMNENITYLKYDIKTKKWHSVDAPVKIAKTLLSKVGHWKFPVINGVISTPTLRYDGTILINEGYDKATRLLMYDPPAMPAMVDNPTRNDAEAAMALLDKLISEFAFIDDIAKSVALSAIITPIVRGAFQVAPMHVNKAPTPGSGKSYLFDVVAAIAIGQRMPVIATGGNNEETEKRLGASLLAGQPLINIDNVNGELSGDALCQYIERPVVQVRVLGKSENRMVESTNTTLFATGNNITLVGDITRRSLICSLDPNLEKAYEKVYNQNPVKMVLANRGEYIAACLTIVRAFLQSKADKAKTLGSFEGWSDTVRSAIMWMGRADPVISMDLARDDDPRLIALTNLVTQWARVIGVGEVSALPVNKIMERCGEKGKAGYDQYLERFPEFFDAVYQVASYGGRDMEARILSKYLRSVKGRLVNGFKFINKTPPSGGLARWWLQKGDDPTAIAVGLSEADNVRDIKF